MESNTYIGQKSNPFVLFNMNLKDLDNKNIDLKEKDNQREYISSISSQYQKEIISLKNYIQKMNMHIRKHLNMEILPSLEEGFSSFSQKMKNGEELSEENDNIINEWLNKLLNVDYINPLITLYENYINNLEEELKYHKETNKKYENTITKIINENNDLRNRLESSEEELKNLLEIRNEGGSSMVIMDRDYMTKLEERNQLLSKENEILLVNYNKLQNELIGMKVGIPNINSGNDVKYQKLSEDYLKIKNDYNALKNNFEINSKKINEISDKNTKLEIDNLQLKKSIEDRDSQLKKYYEGGQRFTQILIDDKK